MQILLIQEITYNYKGVKNLPEIKWDIQLSVTELNNIGEIKPRQNNSNSEVVRVKLTRNSESYDLTALEVFFITTFQNSEPGGISKNIEKKIGRAHV